MAIYVSDKLIKRKQSFGIFTLRVFMVVFAIVISAILINMSANKEGGYLHLAGSSIFSILLIAVAWYIGKIMHVEYKYSMEDGILHVEKSFMHYTCKEVFHLHHTDMELVCRHKSEEDRSHKKVKTMDYSSKQRERRKTVVYFSNEEYGTGRLIFEPNDEIMRSLELFLRDKVHV